MYGNEVHGMSPNELERLRSMTCAASTDAVKGARSALYWSLTSSDDPLIYATSTFERWCKEVWDSTLSGTIKVHSDILQVAEILTVHNGVQNKMADTVGKSWARRNCGPISNMIQWVEKLGWKLLQPTLLQTDDNDFISLREIHPAEIVR